VSADKAAATKNTAPSKKISDFDDPDYWKALINNGLSKFYVLKILYEEPSHGYGILKKLTDLTGGCCIPTFGTIYPVLKKLTEEGYAEILKVSKDESKRPKKVYALTPKGEVTYKIALDVWRSVIPYIYKAIDFEYADKSGKKPPFAISFSKIIDEKDRK
jgi:PadR family transcriptional regulator PadR